MSDRQLETIRWEQDGGIGTITINRPEQFNGMTNTMLRETHELLHDVADDDSVTVLVLTGAGKAFCPGADLKHYTSGAPNEPNKDEYFDVPVMLHESLLDVLPTASTPTLSRTRLSLIPSSARRCSGTLAWVMIAGWLIRLSTPPSDSARPNKWQR